MQMLVRLQTFLSGNFCKSGDMQACSAQNAVEFNKYIIELYMA